jgi:DNA-binding MarR family transcriptional regulator
MSEINHTESDLPLIGLLAELKGAISDELWGRLGERGYGELRPAHGCVFGYLGGEGDRLTALAERSGLTKQAVGEAVADLERLGYVERVPDPADGRAKIIRLSERGREARDEAAEIFADIEGRFAAEVGDERFDEFRATLLDLWRLIRASERSAGERSAARAA